MLLCCWWSTGSTWFQCLVVNLALLDIVIPLIRDLEKHCLDIAVSSGRHVSSTPLTLSKKSIGYMV